MKDIKDYLHLYLGCQCQQMGQEDVTKTYKLTGISYDDTQRQWWAYFENEEDMYAAIEDVFPILRPLSDMMEEETSHWNKLKRYNPVNDKVTLYQEHNEEQFIWLLSKGFDLFGLIEAGLAIDATTLKQKA